MLQALKGNKLLKKTISWFGLFSSFGTLLCCAIPSTLVLLGFGATLASFLGNYPELIWLSDKKGIVFGLSFIMLVISFAGQRYSAGQVCPVYKKEDCETTKDWSRPLLWLSLGINILGSFYAFVLPEIMN